MRIHASSRMVLILTILLIIMLSGCSNVFNSTLSNTNSNEASDIVLTSPSTSPSESPVIKPIEGERFSGDLELPVIGATGFTSVALELKFEENTGAETIELLPAGYAFEILKEREEWWYVRTNNSVGWLEHKYCFINLPDVIPSIVYDNTNTYASKFKSSGKDIPEITDIALYTSKSYNERLEKEEYIMPVLYSMSKRIHVAQKLALNEGNSLKIYEAFRPYSVQKAIVDGLAKLASEDPDVKKGLNVPPWNMSWFIVDGVSNHQVGYSIDVSLIKIDTVDEILIGDFIITQITEYTEYTMPTFIHELSAASAIYKTKVPANSSTAWKSATYAESMNESAIILQNYCTKAGLSPVASEWWHFNDLQARQETKEKSSDGKFLLTSIFSSTPQQIVD
ncbi:hypothetical protein BK120_30120 [Paenibacillus sp. FSL A5-0031]|uniref:M15 family metallopeptidase n=1 Tax=Paenibacillus sp. FSL A5-0031 TaxID=1920420 RepID=UPI00096BF5FF|nr:M15 family metallopeptidase [Paenibacillus sp. FSL A5-0031]OME75923.1 hypothetical protein BK120_30120 [Paenibacillus sp. FSL A5-0031]